MISKEWIDEKIKDDVIIHFKHDEFSKITEIDKGSFGKVSRAQLTSKGLVVALKSFNDNELSVEELQLLRKVNYHYNINRFLGITRDSIGNYALVLEYANEGNLRSYLKNKFTSLKWEAKVQMALDITCGLKCLHSEEIVHRDLHSKNILVNNGRLLIADFGISKQLAEIGTNSIANKQGMIEYIEPQRFKNIQYKKDKKSDIYSLGVLLWEITSGRPPFHNYKQDEYFLLGLGICNGLRETPIEGTPLEYRQLYQECWDYDPNSRPDIEKVYKILIQLQQTNLLTYSQPPHDNQSSQESDNNADSKQHELIVPHNLEKKRNLLIVGYAGSGKSTLSNVLRSDCEHPIRKAKKFQKHIFEWKGIEYHVVDTIGIGNNTNLTKKDMCEKIAEIIYLMPEGISQILFVIDGNFIAAEASTFNKLKDFIFKSGIAEYITIVRTKFANFKNEGECKKDKDDLCKQNETIAKLCKSIVYVDNSPINIPVIDDADDKETIRINKERRDQSRDILLEHLDKVLQEKYYKLKNWDKIQIDIGNIVIENIAEEARRHLEIPALNHPSYFETFLSRLNPFI